MQHIQSRQLSKLGTRVDEASWAWVMILEATEDLIRVVVNAMMSCTLNFQC